MPPPPSHRSGPPSRRAGHPAYRPARPGPAGARPTVPRNAPATPGTARDRDPASLPPWLAARLLLIRPDALVLDKPAGLPVHAGPRAAASLEDWLPLLQLGRRHLPQPAHRLDADTAGCLVLGRTKPALAALGAIFASGRAAKTYWAVVVGAPPTPAGTLDAPLLKTSTAATGWRVRVHPDGQPARTVWRTLSAGDDLTLLELRPETGRTHQLRVHLAHLGCAILGDPLYGVPHAAGLHLLARSLSLPLDPPLAATAPVPPALRPAFDAAGWNGGSAA